MQWYRGRLIAYSLGNFLGYATLSHTGPQGVGGIVTLQLGSDGSWHGGQLEGTVMVDPGGAQVGPQQAARALVQELSRTDFCACGLKFSHAEGGSRWGKV